MTRLLHNSDIPFHALLKVAQNAVREALLTSKSPVAPVVHDWCMFCTIQAGTGRVRVAETQIVLHRPAKQVLTGEKTAGGNQKKMDVPGSPIALRLIVTRVVDENGKVLAEWCFFDERRAGMADAATLGRLFLAQAESPGNHGTHVTM